MCVGRRRRPRDTFRVVVDLASRGTIDLVVSTWANDLASLATELRHVDPTVETVVRPVADGMLVLCGPGRYVNAALGCGRATPLAADDWDAIVDGAATVGVPAAVEVGPTTHPATRSGAAERGFGPAHTRTAFCLPLGDASTEARAVQRDVRADGVELVRVDADRLGLWQAAAAAGFGHESGESRRVSDRWARAALAAGDVMLVAVDHGTPVASSILHVSGRVATLGGMSTTPAARRRGLQALMLHHRLDLAARAGCDLAVSTATNPDSARNLVRAGFREWFPIDTWERPADR